MRCRVSLLKSIGFLILLYNMAFSPVSSMAVEGASQHNIIIGLSPYYSDEYQQIVQDQLFRFILGDVILGSKVSVYDAYNIQFITEFSIPERQAYNNVKVRIQLLKKNLREIKKYLDADMALPDGNEDFVSIIREPQFLAFVGEIRRRSDAPTSVLLLGSPFYAGAKEDGFSMLNGFIPSDGHLLVDRQVSLYGVANKQRLLEGIRVHHVYFSDPWVSDLHEERVRRFWHLFVKGQGGVLVSFSGDMKSTLQRVLSLDILPRVSAEIDPADQKVLMYYLSRNIAADNEWLSAENIEKAPMPTRVTGILKIGIKWECLKCDLDLYSKPAVGLKELSFRHGRTKEGFYFKDYIISPTPVNGLEYVEYVKPVNIHQVKAAVNFYRGEIPGGAKVKVRVFFDGRAYGSEFRIKAERGNRGGDSSNRKNSDYWVVLDIPKLLGLGENGAAEVAALSTNEEAEKVDLSSHEGSILVERDEDTARYESQSDRQGWRVRIRSPRHDDTINSSSFEQMPIERPISGDVTGVTREEIEQFGLRIQLSIITDKEYPQGIVRVGHDGSWTLRKAYFGSAVHHIKAALEDREGNRIDTDTAIVTLIH